ncbi:MAG TPA: GMC family oxidoreductase N-terminal domain-containing protein, partial [bacterium]|nr:GMC family oxidoreductase N-terminal domain-containing protein [bacterium]
MSAAPLPIQRNLEPIVEARNLPRDVVKLACDVVVVGSGAGGSVVATELAEAGLDVIVVEEGGNVPSDVYAKFRPSETLRHMGREGGTTTTIPIGDTPLVSILAGRTVGGSSTMTGGICFRVPELISDGWVKQLGLEDYSAERMAPFYERVEKRVNVRPVPMEMWSRSQVLFAEGAKKCGMELKPFRRNVTEACKGWSRCNFGCPEQAKMSVDISYLPRARAKGARVWADARVDRVIVKGDRAAGVEGRLLNERAGRPGSRFTIESKAVFLCAGTLHTPRLLRNSGVGTSRGVLGRNLTLHPSFRIAALFDEEVRGWDGAMQAAWSDTYEDQGITMTGIFAPLPILAAATPGVAREYMERVKGLGHLATFGGLVHDEGGGKIWGYVKGEPIITYRLAPRDKQRMIQGTRL